MWIPISSEEELAAEVHGRVQYLTSINELLVGPLQALVGLDAGGEEHLVAGCDATSARAGRITARSGGSSNRPASTPPSPLPMTAWTDLIAKTFVPATSSPHQPPHVCTQFALFGLEAAARLSRMLLLAGQVSRSRLELATAHWCWRDTRAQGLLVSLVRRLGLPIARRARPLPRHVDLVAPSRRPPMTLWRLRNILRVRRCARRDGASPASSGPRMTSRLDRLVATCSCRFCDVVQVGVIIKRSPPSTSSWAAFSVEMRAVEIHTLHVEPQLHAPR